LNDYAVFKVALVPDEAFVRVTLAFNSATLFIHSKPLWIKTIKGCVRVCMHIFHNKILLKNRRDSIHFNSERISRDLLDYYRYQTGFFFIAASTISTVIVLLIQIKD